MSVAQATSNCDNSFTITAVPGEEASPSMKSAKIQYDFSKLESSAQVTLEIAPLYDCWEEQKAVRFREVVVHPISKNEPKGSKTFYINSLNAKCFKWRVVIKKNGCTEETPWAFQALIPNRK